eukprot:Pgem_evm1s15783
MKLCCYEKGYAHAVDWWALGVLIFEMRCGQAPFFDNSQMEMYKKIVEGRVIFPGHFKPEEKEIISMFLTAGTITSTSTFVQHDSDEDEKQKEQEKMKQIQSQNSKDLFSSTSEPVPLSNIPRSFNPMQKTGRSYSDSFSTEKPFSNSEKKSNFHTFSNRKIGNNRKTNNNDNDNNKGGSGNDGGGNGGSGGSGGDGGSGGNGGSGGDGDDWYIKAQRKASKVSFDELKTAKAAKSSESLVLEAEDFSHFTGFGLVRRRPSEMVIKNDGSGPSYATMLRGSPSKQTNNEDEN